MRKINSPKWAETDFQTNILVRVYRLKHETRLTVSGQQSFGCLLRLDHGSTLTAVIPTRTVSLSGLLIAWPGSPPATYISPLSAPEFLGGNKRKLR
jgi:hypothetical protein